MGPLWLPTAPTPITNLLQQSQSLDDAAWSSSLTITITADSTTAPDGTLTADTITNTDATATRYQGATVPNDYDCYTASAHLLAGTSSISEVQLLFQGGSSIDTYVRLTHATGAVSILGGGAAQVRRVGVTKLSSTWTRIWITTQNNGSGNTTARLSLSAREAGNTVVAWGAQLVRGINPGIYIPTTTASARRVVA